MSSTPHLSRTSAQPRQPSLHPCIIASIRTISPRIRILKLALPYAVSFLPGQWLDVHIPSLPHAGGFTITSTPRSASANAPRPYFELAIQRSPSNPSAAFLWRFERDLLGQEFAVRVGGNFVWPPTGTAEEEVKRLVLVAGGVGINPLMSILSHLHETGSMPRVVKLLYGTKVFSGGWDEVLFYPRLKKIFSALSSVDRAMTVFSTPGDSVEVHVPELSEQSVEITQCRFVSQDLMDALGPVKERHGVVAYVCGPKAMTDGTVAVLRDAEGMSEERVKCERWW